MKALGICGLVLAVVAAGWVITGCGNESEKDKSQSPASRLPSPDYDLQLAKMATPAATPAPTTAPAAAPVTPAVPATPVTPPAVPADPATPPAPTSQP